MKLTIAVFLILAQSLLAATNITYSIVSVTADTNGVILAPTNISFTTTGTVSVSRLGIGTTNFPAIAQMGAYGPLLSIDQGDAERPVAIIGSDLAPKSFFTWNSTAQRGWALSQRGDDVLGFFFYDGAVWHHYIRVTTNGDFEIKGAITNLYSPQTVYVYSSGDDATARLGHSDKPFATIGAAIDALGTNGGNVLIGMGSFVAPTNACLTNGSTFPLSILGARQPDPNTNYTALTNGTIILGPLCFDRFNVQVRNLGVDSGAIVCDDLYGGTAQEGLLFGNYGQDTNKVSRTGILVDGVTALCKTNSSAVHAVLLENLDGAKISHIRAYYGAHGLAIKGKRIIASDIHSYGHETDCIIIKSDAYAVCSDVLLSGFQCGPIVSGDTGYGVYINSGTYAISNIIVTAGVCADINAAVTEALYTTNAIFNTSISDVTSLRSTDRGFSFNAFGSTYTSCRAYSPAGIGIVIVEYSDNSTVNGCTVTGGATHGIVVTAGTGKIFLKNCQSFSNVGYGLWAATGTTYADSCTLWNNTAGSILGTVISGLISTLDTITAGKTNGIALNQTATDGTNIFQGPVGVGTSNPTNAVQIAGTLQAGAYHSADDSSGGTMTFTNYTHDAAGSAVITNVFTFKNGLFITNTITQ